MKGGDEAIAPPLPSSQPLDWKFSQVFGERTAGEEVQEVDIISAIEFDKTGDHLATGDRGGRVVLFERTDRKDNGGTRKDLEKMDHSVTRHPEFRYKTEFQSHEPEFDYLKSLEIEEKINKIRWCQTANGALFLLSTNDKTIKFWKVQEKKIKKISNMNVDTSKAVGNGCIASSSSSTTHLPNGGSCDGGYNHPSNDLLGAISSLRLQVMSHQAPLRTSGNRHLTKNTSGKLDMIPHTCLDHGGKSLYKRWTGWGKWKISPNVSGTEHSLPQPHPICKSFMI